MLESGRSPEILLIDDNPGDAKLIRLAFMKILTQVSISVVDSAELAFKHLYGERNAAPFSAPDFVFLDLNLPTMNGLTFLELFKNDAKLRSIPVIVISSSNSEKDIAECYQLQAGGFITKPYDLQGYISIAKHFSDYWLKLLQAPRRRTIA